MHSLFDKARQFRALHEQKGAFIIPNPWDIATARILASLEFKALATTSVGYAYSRGQQDHTIGRDQLLEHLREIASATDLPVSADLGNGFGDDPRVVAETIRLAASTGIVGGSIEDATEREDCPIYEIDIAVERIHAAVKVAHELPFPFVLTARAENYLVGNPNLDDTITRLRAYQDAGADVLFAPGLQTKEDIAAICNSVERPVNVMVGPAGASLSMSELAALGVKRISIGPSLLFVAFEAVVKAGQEMRNQGTFRFAENVLSSNDMKRIFAK